MRKIRYSVHTTAAQKKHRKQTAGKQKGRNEMKNKREWIVEYNFINNKSMNSRYFNNEAEANEFAETVNGKVGCIEWIF